MISPLDGLTARMQARQQEHALREEDRENRAYEGRGFWRGIALAGTAWGVIAITYLGIQLASAHGRIDEAAIADVVERALTPSEQRLAGLQAQTEALTAPPVPEPAREVAGE